MRGVREEEKREKIQIFVTIDFVIIFFNNRLTTVEKMGFLLFCLNPLINNKNEKYIFMN